MKKYKKVLAVFVSILVAAAYVVFPAQAASQPRHAPNMYVDWPDSGDYDIMTVDWYCEQDALNTYWAVHNWDNGYAGFQNKDGSHVLLLSLWDLDSGIKPTIEYSRDGVSGEFGGEGTGKQVFTNYEWQTGKWYTMRVQVWTANGKSYFGQWICEEGGGWIKTAVISYPIANMSFANDSVFQEDFTFNNLSRKCRLSNAYGRFYGTTNWDSWTNYSLSNTYFPTSPPTWDSVQWNVNFDCDWGMGNSYVWVQSGGGGFTSNGKTAPATYKVSQTAEPSYSSWISADDAKLGTTTIQYNANGGSGAPFSHSVTKDSSGTAKFFLSSSQPTREGYVFLGWRLENNTASSIQSSSSYVVYHSDNAINNTVLTYYAQWKLDNPGRIMPDYRFVILSAESSSDYVLEVVNGGQTNDHNMQIYSFAEKPWQWFDTYYTGTGYYLIAPVSGWVATVEASGNVVETAPTGSSNQKWYIVPNTGNLSGSYSIISAADGRYLSIDSATFHDGANVSVRNFSNTIDQIWYFVEPANADSGMDNFVDQHSYSAWQYSDVDENMWYGYNCQGVVAQAVRLGIMSGKGNGIFAPDDNLTLAEAIKMACVVNNIYFGGTAKFTQGSPWYQVYVDYAIENGIIYDGQFRTYEASCSRAEMAAIFSNSIPDDQFEQINETSQLPDVSDSTPYSNDIFRLYRAGVLTGNDSIGTFAPSSNITRASAAAIISRIAIPDMRQYLNFK